jgi:TM2 domain-containing membrane protein YozV/ribosomal protein L40E
MYCPKCAAQNDDNAFRCTKCGQILQAVAGSYCRNCGKEVPQNAVVCISCGVAPMTGVSFCQTCGSQTHPAAQVCTKCGVALTIAPPADAKSKLAAGILGIFLGGLGVHRFYLGYTGIGVLQIVVTLVTCGVGSIWGFIEGILILTGSMNKDSEGRPLKD